MTFYRPIMNTGVFNKGRRISVISLHFSRCSKEAAHMNDAGGQVSTRVHNKQEFLTLKYGL